MFGIHLILTTQTAICVKLFFLKEQRARISPAIKSKQVFNLISLGVIFLHI